jgi:hypothetical protein
LCLSLCMAASIAQRYKQVEGILSKCCPCRLFPLHPTHHDHRLVSQEVGRFSKRAALLKTMEIAATLHLNAFHVANFLIAMDRVGEADDMNESTRGKRHHRRLAKYADKSSVCQWPHTRLFALLDNHGFIK